ncbi:OPT oligopeptide transporter [Mycena venus]|uniref:OPT oligopeptide transporter n=1 Tax=Mycena venus TaxID=2733690 RepID=A0A8H6XN01_9AGAR|nr:OPT oligopeptide transporter [Mycena venus]
MKDNQNLRQSEHRRAPAEARLVHYVALLLISLDIVPPCHLPLKPMQSSPSPVSCDEKPVSESSSNTELDAAEYAKIPQLVRDVVGFEDDSNVLTLTFRVVVISTIFVCLGAFTGQLSFFRTTSASFSVFFIVLVSWPVGKMMEQLLPDYRVPLGRFSFSLNPGPWSVKEHVLIGIAGNAASKGNWATYLPANAKIYYNIDMNHAIAFFFGWAVSIVGFSFTAFVRQILIFDPAFIFPVSLQQVTLYRTIHRSTDVQANRQMRGFWCICIAVFVWQFFPEYIFPMTAALAPVCWFGGRNKTASFVGSGMGGMGVLNLTLNVSNITSAIITRPFFVQVILFVGFVITMWILVPIAYFGHKWGSPTFSVMSNGLFTKNGSAYPFASLLTKDGQLNQTRYDEVGLAYAGAQYLWCIFFAYAAFISSFVWMILFAGPQLLAAVKSVFTGKRVHADRLSNMMKVYPEVSPIAWISLFSTAVLVLLVIVLKGHVYMPLFTLFVALAVGAVTTLPMSIVYAISGYQVDVGYFNELVYGYMLRSPGASRHPLGQLTYRIISGNVWYDARDLIEDQKIGHYMHIPPKDVVICQLYGATIGIAVNYATMLWVLSTKLDYLREIKTDPNGEWTGQELKSYNTAGIQYALVGPWNLFADARYQPLWYGFAIGAATLLLVWLLDRRFKGPKFHLWNTTIFFSNMSKYRGNISTGPFTQFILGTVWNFFLYRYRYKFWKRWAYISGAALDTGFNLNLIVIFVSLGVAGITMPTWWGNDAFSVERCFGRVKRS